mgnify:CR=1 FL=1
MLKKSKRGFTLIELLVVVAIIGLLASVVMVSLSSARVKGRDARRISDLHQMRNALELYYSTYGAYPTSSWIKSSDAAWSDSSTSGTLANLLKPYISQLPKDPINSAGANWPYADGADVYTYAYNGYGSGFELLGHFENTSNQLRCQIKKYKRSNGNVWCDPPQSSSNYLFTNDPN